MKMTKICTHSCDLPEDDLSRKRFDIDLRLELALCILDGKIIPFNVTRINHNTMKRAWRDQESVDEFYKFFNGLFTKYGGKLHYIKVEDI